MMHKPQKHSYLPKKQKEELCRGRSGPIGPIQVTETLQSGRVTLKLGIEEGLLAGPRELNAVSKDVAQTRRGRLYLKGLKIQ